MSIKIGLIGCGRILKKHILAINKNSHFLLKAVCDINYSKAKKVSKKLKINSYNSINSMIKNEYLDAVSILTESGNHPKHFKKVSDKVKNIIIEKPISLFEKDLIEIIKLSKKNRNNIFIVKQNRFNPPVQLLKNAIKKKYLGKIHSCSSVVRWSRDQRYYNQAKWRGTNKLDGGVIGNQASHHIDLLTWLNGPVVSIYAIGKKSIVKNIQTKDTVNANLKFKNGSIGYIEATTATRPNDLEGSITFLGDKGSVKIGGFACNKLTTWKFNNKKIEKINKNKYVTNPRDVYGYGHYDFYKKVSNVILKKERNFINIKQIISTTRVIEGINKSLKLNKIIKLK
tara:strand:- start:477 stop:1499 length:1023 start_codon:yes stop_codon:yes gene_type:complete